MQNRIQDENLQAMGLMARLLQADQPLFTPEEVQSFARDTGLEAPDAFRLLIAAALGLAPDENEVHRRLYRAYFLPALSRLIPGEYATDPYYQLLDNVQLQQGGWQLTRQRYAPYQVFPCGNTRLLPDGRTVPRLGFFETGFSYPALLENGREWMTVTPGEIETMRADIAAAQGRALVLGLGLGYFAYMISQKPEVKSVTVIERSASVIALFRDHLLPLFPHGDKLTLIRADALRWLDAASTPFPYNFVYADLWHDVADGVPLYLELQKRQARLGGDWHFWIEPDMAIFLGGLAADPAFK